MKKPRYISMLCMAALLLTACEKDGDTIYTNGGETVALSGDTRDIVLDFSNLDALVLTVYWNDNGKITTSDPNVDAPQYTIDNTIQMSGSPEFTSVVETAMEKGKFERQFICSELNNLLGRIGFEGGVQAPLYIRVKSVLGNNIAPQYSNTLVVNVTPYLIDMTEGKFLNTAKEETGRTLYSENADHVYKGFIGAGGWENWYLAEGNGVLLGNENQSWYAFKLGSTETNNCGNMWYPGISGCYYTIVDGQLMEWSSLLIPALTVGGDIQGEMEYDRKANHWTYSFTATAGTLNITLSGTGKQYNVETGTNDANAIDKAVSFGGSPDNLTFNKEGAAPTISVPVSADGDATLLLELADPRCWTVKVVSGGVEGGATIDPHLWITGVDDGITGSWGYDNYLVNYNEDAPLYGGVLDVNSLWGYVFMKEAAWGDGYGFDSGDAMEGTLNTNVASNIPAPAAGLYLFDVSLAGMTYKLTAVTEVGYAGLNDNWDIQPMTQVSRNIFRATVEKTATTPWGVKIILNNNWELFFGGNGKPGELILYANGFEGDNDLPNGTYTLTVDLGHGTYKYEPVE